MHNARPARQRLTKNRSIAIDVDAAWTKPAELDLCLDLGLAAALVTFCCVALLWLGYLVGLVRNRSQVYDLRLYSY